MLASSAFPFGAVKIFVTRADYAYWMCVCVNVCMLGRTGVLNIFIAVQSLDSIFLSLADSSTETKIRPERPKSLNKEKNT